MDDTARIALEKNRDALSNALQAMGLGTILNPEATTREGVLVLAGTLFAELVGSASQAQYAAADREEMGTGSVAFVQGWGTTFEVLNEVRGPENPITPRTQVSLLSTTVELVAKVVESYIQTDAPDPRLIAAAAAIEAGADCLALATFDPGDQEGIHTYTHAVYDGLATAQKASFYAATHSGPYTEED